LTELEKVHSTRWEGQRGFVYAVSGRRAEALDLLAAMEARSRRGYVSPVARALIHIGLGDKDQAFALLNEGYEKRDPQLLWLTTTPLYDAIRSDPRWVRLLERLHLRS
jgi:hypothetical protein